MELKLLQEVWSWCVNFGVDWATPFCCGRQLHWGSFWVSSLGHLFCEVINYRVCTWHRSDRGETGPSALAGSSDRVGEIQQCCWLYTEMKSCCMHAEYLSLRKDLWMAPSHVSDWPWFLERRLPPDQSINSHRPGSRHARTWHGDIMMKTYCMIIPLFYYQKEG